MKNSIDKIFKEKISDIASLPNNIQWTPEKGWDDYQKIYHKGLNPFVRNIILVTSVAATVAILIGFAISTNFFSPKVIVARSNTDSIKELSLPNGTQIWMNKNTSISYSIRKSGEFTLDVSGEIYIETKSAVRMPYTIKAGNAIISVQNQTALNIKAFPNDIDIDITVAKGSVKVSDNILGKGLALLITKDNYCSVSRTSSLVFATTNTNNNFLAWKTGKLVFNETPMATVTQILSSFYGKDIVIVNDSIAYYIYTGTFYNTTFDSVMAQIMLDMNIEMGKFENFVTISRK